MKNESINELKKEAGAYYLALERCQNLLAEYIVPNSGISELQVISNLLGILDDQNLVKQMRTGNQWIVYHSRLISHEEYCEKIKPQKSDYGYINNMPPDADGERAYEIAMSEWHMKLSCDAPNEPGYYRANND